VLPFGYVLPLDCPTVKDIGLAFGPDQREGGISFVGSSFRGDQHKGRIGGTGGGRGSNGESADTGDAGTGRNGEETTPRRVDGREHGSFDGHDCALPVADVFVGGVLYTRSALAMDFNPFDG
jgi:hypothetical protein